MSKTVSINGNRENITIRFLKNEPFVLDSRYIAKEVIYETDYYVVAVGTEHDPTPVREIEIKKYRGLFRRNWNWNLSLKVLNELKVYNTLKDQTKMVSLLDIVLPLNIKSSKDKYRKIFNRMFKDMYLVFERCGKDLSYILTKKEEPPPPLEMSSIQQKWLLSELLSAVSSLHSQKLMHRDLRPSNVSVNFEEKTVRLKNFGLSSGFSSKVYLQEDDAVEDEDDADEDEEEEEEDEEKTDVEITPIYTAPEILLGKAIITPLVDVWGVGCIFAEILSGGGGSPLFFLPPGTKPTTPNKIGAIFTTLETHGSLDKLSPSNSLAIDLLRKMLDFDPGTRISLEEAMQHAYFGVGGGTELVGGSSSSSSSIVVAQEPEDMDVVEVTEPAIGVVEPDAPALRNLIWKEMETFDTNKKKMKTSEIPLMKKMKTSHTSEIPLMKKMKTSHTSEIPPPPPPLQLKTLLLNLSRR